MKTMARLNLFLDDFNQKSRLINRKVRSHWKKTQQTNKQKKSQKLRKYAYSAVIWTSLLREGNDCQSERLS